MAHHLLRKLTSLAHGATMMSISRGGVYHRLLEGMSRNGPANACLCQQHAALSTSRTAFVSANIPGSSTDDDVDVTNVSGKKKTYWRSYGFDIESEYDDRLSANAVMFCTITGLFVFVGFIIAYFPDINLRDWSQREAYIEIARREALGLPHVDRNLVPPELINLPTDEELGDFEIII